MKVAYLLPLAALSSAFVLPDEQVLQELASETKKGTKQSWALVPYGKDQVLDTFKDIFEDVKKETKHAFDAAIDFSTKKANDAATTFEQTKWDVEAWLESETSDLFGGGPHHPGHPDKPDHPHDPPPHHGPPHHGPHDPHHKPNKTLWELIDSSKYTTKLAHVLKHNATDLVKLLNCTSHNFTIFAPIDSAFPEHRPHHNISQALIEKVLGYHIVPGVYPAGRVLGAHTLPTIVNETNLGGPQRLRFGLGFRGLSVNFYSKIVAVNIFGTNGVIHGVEHILVPPPPALKIIELLPGDFSTLTLGLGKTGLLHELNSTDHVGGTLFAPDNFAFKKLGPRINAFLFSKYGEKYLKALLEYHVVNNHTVYSNAYYAPHSTQELGHDDHRTFHVDLPTLLDDKSLSVDIARFGPFIEYKINGFSRVKVQDGIAKDGVIQVVSNVLIPPKTHAGAAEFWNGEEEMSVEELKERLQPLVDEKQDL